MLFDIDCERTFSDIKTYRVDAVNVVEAAAAAIELAKKDNWLWPHDPEYSIRYSAVVEEDL